MPPTTVICVPGMWKDRSELVEKIVSLSGGYLFTGSILMHIDSGAAWELDVRDHDPNMLRAFQTAGPHWRNTPEMERIAGHTMVTYIVGEGGTIAKADAFMKAAEGLLRAGGLGVKVESTGMAFNAVDWTRMAGGILTAHQAFVVYITGQQAYSCGMHYLGLRDAIVESAQAEDPVELLRVFTQYQYREKPSTQPGHTFSVDAESPRYRIGQEEDSRFGDESLFHNPYGLWRLTAV